VNEHPHQEKRNNKRKQRAFAFPHTLSPACLRETLAFADEMPAARFHENDNPGMPFLLLAILAPL
jgi:hypothetical protein